MITELGSRAGKVNNRLASLPQGGPRKLEAYATEMWGKHPACQRSGSKASQAWSSRHGVTIKNGQQTNCLLAVKFGVAIVLTIRSTLPVLESEYHVGAEGSLAGAEFVANYAVLIPVPTDFGTH